MQELVLNYFPFLHARFYFWFLPYFETVCCITVKSKVNHAPQESIGGAHLPLLGLKPVGGEPLMSVTRGHCNARPTVTFPAARHHHLLDGTKLYCLVTEAHVC